MCCYRGSREVVDKCCVKTQVPVSVMQSVLGEEHGKEGKIERKEKVFFFATRRKILKGENNSRAWGSSSNEAEMAKEM